MTFRSPPSKERRRHKESKRRRNHGGEGNANEMPLGGGGPGFGGGPVGFGGMGGGGGGMGFGRPKSNELCKAFMAGKCHKDPMSCNYSHEVEPPKVTFKDLSHLLRTFKDLSHLLRIFAHTSPHDDKRRTYIT